MKKSKQNLSRRIFMIRKAKNVRKAKNAIVRQKMAKMYGKMYARRTYGKMYVRQNVRNVRQKCTQGKKCNWQKMQLYSSFLMTRPSQKIMTEVSRRKFEKYIGQIAAINRLQIGWLL